MSYSHDIETTKERLRSQREIENQTEGLLLLPPELQTISYALVECG
jgi:hypothetical protein